MPISKVAIIKKNYTGTTRIFQAASLIILVAAGTWGFLQFQKLTAAQEALAKGRAEMTTLQTEVEDYAQEYKDLVAKISQDNEETINSVRAVLPEDEGYTVLTRTLDLYANAADTNIDPFFSGSLSFSQPIINANKEYAELPFTMSLVASRKNFDDFLRYVETSGDLDTRVRLMDIKQISLQLPTPEESVQGLDEEVGPETLNISFSLSTYFQKPVGVTGTPQ